MPKANIHDDTVYSNVSYLGPAAGLFWADEWVSAAVMLGGGVWLAVASGRFHAELTRHWQGMDVRAMMTYLSAVAAVVGAEWTQWAYGVVPLATAFYWRYVWDISSTWHVPAWVLVILAMLAVQVQWWALMPAVLFAGGGLIKLLEPGVDTELHSLWHFLGGASATAAVLL